jgi:hypothetical protein
MKAPQPSGTWACGDLAVALVAEGVCPVCRDTPNTPSCPEVMELVAAVALLRLAGAL